jgi:hypothetical protein
MAASKFTTTRRTRTWRRLVRGLWQYAGSGWWRVLVVLVALVTTGWLFYSQVWMVLENELPWPAGVTSTVPTVESQLLQQVNESRLRRSQTQWPALPEAARRVFR